MAANTICKTIHQYNREPISREDMKKLLEIADDYKKVKNYVYQRYGGIAGLARIYPGYTVQNEMTKSGIRQKMGLPSVYFYLAIYDALGNIKAEWTRLKKQVLKNVSKNENFSEADRHYLRFVIKMDKAFEAVLAGKEIQPDSGFAGAYEAVCENVDDRKLNSYLRRQVRRHHKSLHSTIDDNVPKDFADGSAGGKTIGFAIAERAYRYADHGIYITTKKRRDRVFVPLTDHNCYGSQLYIKLYPQDGNLEISVPLRRKVVQHPDHTASVGIALGMQAMLTTDQGHVYGSKLGEYESAYADWIRQQNIIHSQNTDTGRKKYNARKNRFTEKLHSYINHELNRFFAEEKPQKVYVVKLPDPARYGSNRKINNAASMWRRGYIRNRLSQKCMEHSVELIQVFGKDISRECSNCGAFGVKEKGMFRCEACGFLIEEKQNTAANVLHRGAGQ